MFLPLPPMTRISSMLIDLGRPGQKAPRLPPPESGACSRATQKTCGDEGY
jgi:hypothetical protein